MYDKWLIPQALEPVCLQLKIEKITYWRMYNSCTNSDDYKAKSEKYVFATTFLEKIV